MKPPNDLSSTFSRTRWQFSLGTLLWLVALTCVASAAVAAMEGGLGAVVRGAVVGWLACMIVEDFKRATTHGVVAVAAGAVAGTFGAGFGDDLLLGAIFGGLAGACAVRLVRSRLPDGRFANEPVSPLPGAAPQSNHRRRSALTPALVSLAAGVGFGLVLGAIGYFTALPLDRWHAAGTLFTLSSAVGGFVAVVSAVATFAVKAEPPADAGDGELGPDSHRG